jgi:hypothetical protein
LIYISPCLLLDRNRGDESFSSFSRLTCTALKERAPHAQAFVLPPSLPDQKGRRTLMYPTTETLRRVSESLEGVNRRARWGVASFVSHRSVESSEMRKKTIAYTDQKYFEYF